MQTECFLIIIIYIIIVVYNCCTCTGRVDTFSVRCGALGRVDRVRLRHDNSGIGPSWFVDWVEVREEGEKGDRVCVGG